MKKAAIGLFCLFFWLFACSADHPHDRRVLRYGLPQAPVSLDPAVATDLSYSQIVFNIYETLVRFDWDSGQFVPVLAASWEQEQEGLCWKFSLRPNIIFHDGTPFTAEAVKISFERQFDSDCRYFRAGKTDTHGAVFRDVIEEIRIIDDFTIAFILRHPHAAFLDYLASPIMATIVSPSALAKLGEAIGEHPVGTGPFEFVQSDVQEISLRRFERYWGKLPDLQEVNYKIVPVLTRRVEQLERGALNVITGLSPVTANRLYHSPEIEVLPEKLLATTFLGFHCQKPPFTEVSMRKAVAASLNVPELIAFASQGFATPAQNPLPATAFGHFASLVQTAYDSSSHFPIAGNDHHKALFDTLYLHYFVETDSLRDHPLAQALKTALRKAGLQLELVRHQDWEAYSQQVLRSDLGHLFWEGWTGYHRHADGFLYPLFHSRSQHNYFQYQNPQVDELLELARHTLPATEQEEIYRQVQEIILAEVPAVFLSHPQAVYALRRNVAGFKVDPLAIPWLHEVTLK